MKKVHRFAIVGFVLLCAAAAFPQEQQPTRVRVAKVSSGSIARNIESTGVLKAWRDVTVASKGAGTVTAVRCEMGQRVAEGAVLVELDSEVARAAVQEAQAAKDRAEAQLAQSTTDLGRAEKLLATDDISAAEWEMLSLRKQEVSAGLSAARAQLTRAEKALRDTRVKAPFSGTVAQRFVEFGSWLTPGQPVAQVVELNRMKGDFGIPQQRRPEVRVGMNGQLTVDLYPGTTFDAEVIRVGVVADPASGQFTVEIAVAQSASSPLRPGTSARLVLGTDDHGSAVLVPKTAVLDRGGQSFVMIVDSGRTARMRQVALGATTGGSREVISGGLKAGDLVITDGKDRVVDGERVQFEGP